MKVWIDPATAEDWQGRLNVLALEAGALLKEMADAYGLPLQSFAPTRGIKHYSYPPATEPTPEPPLALVELTIAANTLLDAGRRWAERRQAAAENPAAGNR